jgi:hypothetical protein
MAKRSICLVTGKHREPEFRLTYEEIEPDGFRIDAKVEMLHSNSACSPSTPPQPGIGLAPVLHGEYIGLVPTRDYGADELIDR